MIPVSTPLPNLRVQDERCEDLMVITLSEFVPDIGNHPVEEDHAPGMPEGHSRRLLMEGKEIHLLPDLPVIPLPCFLKPDQMFFEL